jgi:superfamily II RNA helicase
MAVHQLERFSSATNLLDTIANGVAYHHAGLLPPLKQAVEILFGMGLIKVLFATETFALGINMPAKSVVFSSLEKNDGVSFRYLKSYEFQQMAGRAGRRGIDDIGYVYINIEPKFSDYGEIKSTVFGRLEPISSQFGFAYSSLLNLFMRHDISEIKELARLSLANYQNDGEFERVVAKISSLETELSEMSCRRGRGNVLDRITTYNELSSKLQSLKNEMSSIKDFLRSKGYRGEEKKKERLIEISEQIKSLRKMLIKNPCKKCYDGSRCMYLITQLKNLKKKKNKLENHLDRAIDLKFKFLERIGYIDKNEVLPRGEFASDIFGFEITATELYFDGLLHSLEPVEICAILSTLTYEKRRDETSRIRDRAFKKLVKNYISKVEKILKIEKKIIGEEVTKLPDPGFVDAIIFWASGAEFEEMVNRFTRFAEGDIIRQIRQVIDLIRQFKRALRDDSSTREKLDRCLELINRDVVDAEKYL